MSLVDGQVLDGKYVITRRLAEGGMSTVFLGVNERIGKEVAVKVLHPAVAREEDVVQRFEREARIASRIRSPHVADVYDFGVLDDGARFMVMEYLDGESLAAQIERDHTIATRPLANMALQILAGLSAAHASGVIHRDLKPENVIVTKRGKDVVVKLVDFGISKVLEGSAFNGKRESIFAEAKATAAGAVLGTPLYMSPEQARGATNLIDQRTDLYSLGVILYEAIAGEPPLMGDNVNDLLFRVALDEPIPLQQKVPNVDPGFAAIVMKALAKDVTARWQSADDMHDAIEAWKCQFTSGAQSVVPVVAPVNHRVETLAAVVTPMSLTTPTPREEARTRRVVPLSLVARARKYAFAIPAAAMMLLLVPAVKHAFQKDASAPLDSMPISTTTTTAAERELAEPVTLPPALTIAAVEPKAAAPAKPAVRWVPVRHRAPAMDAGSGSDTFAEPIATASPSPLAPAAEAPNAVMMPSNDEPSPPIDPAQTEN